MPDKTLIDPELRETFEKFPSSTFDRDSLAETRAQWKQLFDSIPLPDVAVDRRHIMIEGSQDAPPIPAALLTPAKTVPPSGAILHVHGGGYFLGDPRASMRDLLNIADSVKCVILSIDYRLAPETKAPGAVEDGYAGLRWLWKNAPDLGIDRGRIAVMGESAGGGLAAALALLARDRGEIPLALQVLDSPMLDDRTCVRPRHPVNSDYTWTFEHNQFGWSCLLEGQPGGAGVSYYASPARAEDLRGLPPTFISCGSLDLFIEENVDYARRLAASGVLVELHVYPGAYHGYALKQDAAVTQAAMRDKDSALRRVLLAAPR